MDENLRLIGQLLIYIILIPIIFKVLKNMRIEEMFKKGATRYIIAFYIITTLVISKILGDLIFFIITFGTNLQ